MNRVCKKCGIEKSIEEFTKSPTCRFGRTYECFDCNHKYGSQRYHRTKVLHPRLILTEKACCRCGKIFPLTNEYFFTKQDKIRHIDGSIKIYRKFTHVCKVCHSVISTEKNRRKRCIELGCDLTELKKTVLGEMAFKKLKYKELKDVPYLIRMYCLRYSRKEGRLVMPSEYEDLKIKHLKQKWINQRKFNYGNVEKVTRSMSNNATLIKMTDARIALILGMPVKEVPKEIIEVKRALIMLKREANLIHSTKKHI